MDSLATKYSIPYARELCRPLLLQEGRPVLSRESGGRSPSIYGSTVFEDAKVKQSEAEPRFAWIF